MSSVGGEDDDTREEEEEDDGDQKPAAKDDGEGRRREIMAAAAMKRSATLTSPAARDVDDDDMHRRSSSNKRLKAADDDGMRREGNGRNADGAEGAKIGEDEGEVEGNVGDNNGYLALALKMMDASWSIFLSHAGNEETTAATAPVANAQRSDDEEGQRWLTWAGDRLPRVLRCIGDLHTFQGEHGNAVNVYIQSMQYQEDAHDRWRG